MIKQTIVSIVFLFLVIFCHGQALIEFEKTTHDFGIVKETEGPVEHVFHFVNGGDRPIKITRVKASCGCTTPAWSREEVMPGDSGFIKARYNPRNRPGRFSKSLKVSTTDASQNKTLFIKGHVDAKPKSPEEEYRVSYGSFGLKNKMINVGKITTEKKVERSIPVHNFSEDTLNIDYVNSSIPEHLSIAIENGFIGPKKSSGFMITYDPILKKDYGLINDNLLLAIGDTLVQVPVMATIEEFFPEMTPEELENAPKLSITSRVADLGEIRAGNSYEASFQLENTGNEKLSIRAIKSNCACLTYEFKSKSIKKGKSRTLNVYFDASDLRGNQYKTISVFANDPVNPTQVITIKGSVKK